MLKKYASGLLTCCFRTLKEAENRVDIECSDNILYFLVYMLEDRTTKSLSGGVGHDSIGLTEESRLSLTKTNQSGGTVTQSKAPSASAAPRSTRKS